MRRISEAIGLRLFCLVLTVFMRLASRFCSEGVERVLFTSMLSVLFRAVNVRELKYAERAEGKESMECAGSAEGEGIKILREAELKM